MLGLPRPPVLLALALVAVLAATLLLLAVPPVARTDEFSLDVSSDQAMGAGPPAESSALPGLLPYALAVPRASVENAEGVRIEEPAVPNFGWAEEGSLARCGQPSADGFRVLRDKYNIGAVVNLRAETNDEEPIVKSLGMTYMYIPVPDNYAPSPQDVTLFLQFVRDMNRQGKSVVVHCAAGVGRTGTVVALYRLEQGHPVEHALKEAITWGMSLVWEHSGREQLAAINDYAAKLGRALWYPPNFDGARKSPYSYTPIWKSADPVR